MELFFVALLLFLHAAYAIVNFPEPHGKYGVGMQSMIVMTDTSRKDPYDPKKGKRSIVVSTFYPTALRSDCTWSSTKYMPDKTAEYLGQGLEAAGLPKGTFQSLRLKVCDPKDPTKYDKNVPGFSDKNFPVVVFSPGNMTPRFYYSALAQEVASHGYTVVSLDHPYDAPIVEYPDGKTVFADPRANGDPDSEIPLVIDTRAKDQIFVLDQLTIPSVVKKLFPKVYSGNVPPNLGHVPIYGHSAGGGSATLAMQRDSRVPGVINMDGDLDTTGVDLKKGLKNPYMLFLSDWARLGVGEDPSWAKIFPHLNWGLEIEMKKSGHGTFEDTDLWIQLLGAEIPASLTDVFGTIPGDMAMKVKSSYVVAFLDFVMSGKQQKLLKGPSKDFPEVKFLRSST